MNRFLWILSLWNFCQIVIIYYANRQWCGTQQVFLSLSGYQCNQIIFKILDSILSFKKLHFYTKNEYQLSPYINSHNIESIKAWVCYFLSNFYFFVKWSAFKSYEKCFLFYLKSFLLSRYSIFCNFSPSFPHFLDSKGQLEVE